jgi:hypothetical protein
LGEIRNANKTLVGNHEGKSAVGRLDVDERIILKWILEKQVGRMWTVMNRIII